VLSTAAAYCQPQAEALNQPGVLKGRSLVFAAPTSAGKSAVAEVLMLRRLCDRRMADRVALLVLPFVSLCQEKEAHLERLIKPLEKWARRSWNALPDLAVCMLKILHRAHVSRKTLCLFWQPGVLLCTPERWFDLALTNFGQQLVFLILGCLLSLRREGHCYADDHASTLLDFCAVQMLSLKDSYVEEQHLAQEPRGGHNLIMVGEHVI
jgi:hypothetical protein